MEHSELYEIFPLGDAALTIDLGNRICGQLNDKVLAMQRWLNQHSFEGIRDLVIGYSSLSIFYDPVIIQRKNKLHGTSYNFVKAKMEEAFAHAEAIRQPEEKVVDIPVCYEESYAPDLNFVSQATQLTREEVIRIHSSIVYRVFMIGFLPGFAYMGKLDPRIQVDRKVAPVQVTAGSVGIANGQTGIYPLPSPGGWHIIGKTPLSLFRADATSPVWLKAGDVIRFHPVSSVEFNKIAAAQKT